MNIVIHRGQNQIGGNIIEVATKKTKIMLDIGIELTEGDQVTLPKIDGLFGYQGYDGVIISHYHGDHMGLAYYVDKKIPLFMGEDSYKIIAASDRYKKLETIKLRRFLRDQVAISVGDIKVTPYLVDHSAYDAYMILVEAEGKKVLYTGDFRSNGRKSFERLVGNLPTKVDAIICEGTSISRGEVKNITEQELEVQAISFMRKKTGPIFVLQSSMNIDRIVTVYRAAKQCNRVFLQDLYLTEITSAIGNSIPNPKTFPDVRTFLTRAYMPEHFRYQMFNEYGAKKIGKAQIMNACFVMCIRASMLRYMKSLRERMPFEDGLLFYSFWNGYKAQPEIIELLDFAKEVGLEVVDLHTSGHADADAIKALVEHTNPDMVIPIHTENANWFVDTFRNLKVIMSRIIEI